LLKPGRARKPSRHFLGTPKIASTMPTRLKSTERESHRYTKKLRGKKVFREVLQSKSTLTKRLRNRQTRKLLRNKSR
jgi:hypothetical protein